MVKPLAQSPGGDASLAGKSFVAKGYEKVKYELPVFILLLMLFLPQNLRVTNDIYSTLHIFDYRIGFAPRLLIGSIMSLFTDYKSQAFMESFFSVVFIMEALLFAFVAGRIIRKAGLETRETTVFFVVLFFAVPYSLGVLYPRLLSLDRFLVLFTLLALMVLNKKGFKWIVPVLIAAGLATYHGFAFTYMPAIALLLIYEVIKNKKSAQSILLCAAGFVTMAVFSTYFFLFDGLDNFQTIDDLIAYAAGKTDLQFVGYFKEVAQNLLLISPSDFYWNLVVPAEGYKDLTREIIAMIYLSPLIAVLFSVWKNAVKASSKKAEKFVFVLCILAPVARFPMFILSTNYYRGRTSVIIVQFFLLFYFLHTQNPAVLSAVKKIGDFFKKNYLLFLAMVIYFAMPFLAYNTGELWSALTAVLAGKL
jgi:hypothetical protein